ncbi:hypothetical protein ALMP_42320 [Streptomyces sp. A012304]|nr:hypothetical protein ALMP_42320 [Streptomyces sp. A012304]
MPGEVVAPAVVVELGQQALPYRGGVGGAAEVDPLVDDRGGRAVGVLVDLDLAVDVPADVDGGADGVAQPVQGVLELLAQGLRAVGRGAQAGQCGPGDIGPSLICSTYPSRRSIRRSVVSRSVPRPVSRASSVSVTPVVWRATDSRTRRASWAEWLGVVGSCFSATVFPLRSLLWP